ncbi:MAG: Hsp20/alpha crystallin family protein [Thermoguttaceae bacterium]|nr:Hsp20/alpha crystallin family protein [Thermoguttaceae bacterium]MBR4102450.1 Hsp20/alpha crystallin family protein [Thermoguttaceae bacterium]
MLTDYLVPRGYAFASPFDFRRGMNRFFSDLTSETRGGLSFAPLENRCAPSVWETPDEYFVEVAAPGLAEDAVSVEIVGSELTICLRRSTQNDESENGRYWRRERTQGDSTFTVSFPSAVDAEQAEANLERGVLLLKVPKMEKARVKKINVNKTMKLDGPQADAESSREDANA